MATSEDKEKKKSVKEMNAFLRKSGVMPYLQDMVGLLVENRPERPLAFMSEYFQATVQVTDPASRSFAYIRRTSRHRKAFMDNLFSAFVALKETQGKVLLRDFRSLVQKLCQDFPVAAVDRVLATTQSSHGGSGKTASVSWPAFCSGITACLRFEEFFAHLEWHFKQVDSDACGYIPCAEFLAIIEQAKQKTLVGQG